ncbi:MAG: phosphate ABC transporter substrate-binding protein [Candidatus Altiarchaeia archaeon]
MKTNGIKYGLLIAVIGALLFAGCSGNNNGGKQADTLSVAGSTTVQPIAAKAAEKYNQEQSNVVVSVQGGGSGAGIKMAIEGSADIGASSRELTADELKDLKAYEIAADGIAVIVNPGNTLTDLTKAQIKDIFSGKIKNFKELGGPDKEIVVIIRESGSGTRSSFEEMLMDKGKTNNSEGAEQQASNGAVKASIASNPNAIGYIGAGYVDPTVKALNIGGVAPTRETIKAGTYPVSRKLYMVTKGEAAGKSRAFIDYILSDEGQKIVEEEGFVSIK